VWFKNLDRSFFRFVTIHAFDRQTDGQTAFSSLDCVCIPCSAVTIQQSWTTGGRCSHCSAVDTCVVATLCRCTAMLRRCIKNMNERPAMRSILEKVQRRLSDSSNRVSTAMGVKSYSGGRLLYCWLLFSSASYIQLPWNHSPVGVA